MGKCRWMRMLPAGALLLGALSLEAKVELAPVFSDNAVLQRDMAVPVWGKADPGEAVTISFAGQSVSGTAGDDGRWMVNLAPMTASKENRTLTVQGNANTVEAKNILVGEVWLASGQSNMEWRLRQHNNRTSNGEEIAKTVNEPLIRFITTRHQFSQTPSPDDPVEWHLAQPGDNFRNMTAVGYFFAKEIVDQLDVPVGIIGANWGGTRIEPWIAPEGFNSVPELADLARTVNAKIPGTEAYKSISAKVAADYEAWLAKYKEAAARGETLPVPPNFPNEQKPYENHQQPTVLYNKMLYRYVPYAMRGAIWYQGESNVTEGMLYGHKMQALLDGWKQVFRNPDFKLYFAQLAPYTYGGNDDRLPLFWEAQQAFADREKDAGMAVISDAVHKLNDIHPTDKETVGKRLAYLALNRDYGRSDIKADSPRLRNARVEGNRYILEFDHVENWKVTDGKPIEYFEIAGADNIYVPAKAEINGARLIVSSPEITEPKSVRYMWHQLNEGKLTNEAGLLLGAFREENFPTREEIRSFIEQNNKLVFEYDLLTGSGFGDKTRVNYVTDNSGAVKGKIKRVTYFAVLQPKDGPEQFVAVSMDPFTADPRQLGVPVKSAGPGFQQIVTNLRVISNVSGVRNGAFADGNIEFWSNNYGGKNAAKVPGADDRNYDFGDERSADNPGYGSMQIHNYRHKQTVLAYNNFSAGRNADIGIGNAPGNNTDWTFSKSASKYDKATLYIYVEEGEPVDPAELLKPVFDRVPEAAALQPLYVYDLTTGSGFGDKTRVNYLEDFSGELNGDVKRVAYFMLLKDKSGQESWVYAAMDAFDPSPAKLGVPVKSTGAIFQKRVANLEVKTNVDGVKQGSFPEGNIEFWPTDYSGKNSADVPGATDAFDFGDSPTLNKNPGYGSMQVHNFQEKQTVFAYNKFDAGRNADVGIGNAPGNNTDWTFTKSMSKYDSAMLYVLVEMQ